MTKILYLVRHAKAEDKGEGMSDFERKLTEKGQRDAMLIGKRLHTMAVAPDHLITSPASRALETCQLVAEEIGFAPGDVEYERELFDADTFSFANVIRSIPDEHDKVMIFGHNPSISEIAGYLCGDIVENLSKGAVAAIRMNVSRWSQAGKNTGEKIFLETPKSLSR